MSTDLITVNLTNSTADAPSLSDNSTALITSAWVKSLLATYGASPGSYVLPGGLVIKIGSISGMPDTTAVSVGPLPGGAFPSNFFGVMAIDTNHVGGNNRPCGAVPTSLNGFNVSAQGSGANVFWVAFGD